MKTKKLPNKKEILRRFMCNPIEGKLYYKIWVSGLPKDCVGKEAGYSQAGRRIVRISGKSFYVSRIIWAVARGRISKSMEIDHIDRNRSNDKISNLRIVSRGENLRNKNIYKSNSSGHFGVSFHKRAQRWFAQCVVNGKNYHGGYFNSKKKAAEAALNLRRKMRKKYPAKRPYP